MSAFASPTARIRFHPWQGPSAGCAAPDRTGAYLDRSEGGWRQAVRLGAVVTPLLLGLLALGACGSSAGASPPPCSGSTPAALTVKNYLSWCAVSVEGAAASTAAAQTVCVADGSVALSATALTGFELGPAPWHRTVGDAGSGDPGTVTGTGQAATSSTTVDVTGASACVWVCCPFTNGTGCPATDPCAAPPSGY